MGAVFGKPPVVPVGSKLSNGKAVSEMPTLTEAEKDERRKRAENCICPFLKAAYVQGKLDADEVGYAPLQDCYAVQDWAGVPRLAFPQDGYCKKFGLTGVPILHLARPRTNDTGILHPYIGEEERYEHFKKFLDFANKKGEIGTFEMNKAVYYYIDKCKGGKSGLKPAQVEFSGILTTFGRYGFPFRKYLTVDDFKKIWVDSEFPDGWIDNRRTPETGFLTMVGLTFVTRFLTMQLTDFIAGLFGNGPKLTDPVPRGFAPRPDYPYSDVPNEPPMSQQDVAKVPGNYERGISLFDSRSGAVQDLVQVNGGKEWVLNDEKNQEWWQLDVDEALKKRT